MASVSSVGGGPLLDMGPYYVSTLIHVFGPVAAVAALGLKGSESRVVQVGPLTGEEFPVEIPSTVSVLMQFEQGGQAQSLYSTDSPLHRHGVVEITGTEGTMVIPDPNTFGGAITITRPLSEAVVPPAPVVQEIVDVPQEGVLAGRGLGLLDMARSIRADRPHIATGRFGYHVLDTLLLLKEAALRIDDQLGLVKVGLDSRQYDLPQPDEPLDHTRPLGLRDPRTAIRNRDQHAAALRPRRKDDLGRCGFA